MNSKYLFSSFAAAALLAVGCTVEQIGGDLEEIKIDNTIVSLPEKGGDATLNLTAAGTWHLDESTLNLVDVEVEDPANPGSTVTEKRPWLKVTPSSGEAGEFEIVFSADAAELDRADTVSFICGTAEQQVIVNQPGDPALAPQYPAVEAGEYWIMVNTGTDEEPVWKVAKPVGASDTYGYLYCDNAIVDGDVLSSTAANVFTLTASGDGFTIQDASGRYYYMTGTYNSFNVTTDASQSGNVWTISQTGDKQHTVTNAGNGKILQYSVEYSSFGAYSAVSSDNLMPYLVKAEAPAPDLITVDQTEWTVKKAAGTLDIPAEGTTFVVGVDYEADWLQYVGVKYVDGVSCLEFDYTENPGPDTRTVTVSVLASDGSNETSVELEIVQLGGVVDATAAEINAAEDGPAEYRYTGYLREVDNDLYGNLYVTDYTGEVYIYGVLDENGESQKWASMGINEGDIITVVGPKSSHNGNPQLKNVSVESFKSVTDVTLSEFIAAGAAEDVWYRLTGTVDNIYNAEYGNFHLLDDAGNDVVVYGLVAGWGGPSKEFASLGIQEGDVITIVGVRDEYEGTIQVGDAFFVSKEAGSGEEPGEGDVVIDFSALGLENASDIVDLTVDGIVIDGAVGSNTYGNTPKFYSGDNTARIYVGNTLTISGADMTSIVFTFERGADLLSADPGTYSSETATWTGESDSVTFTSAGTVRIEKIVVTLAE